MTYRDLIKLLEANGWRFHRVGKGKDRPTEVNCNVPDISVEPDIQDYLSGRDPVVERAIAVLMKSSAK